MKSKYHDIHSTILFFTQLRQKLLVYKVRIIKILSQEKKWETPTKPCSIDSHLTVACVSLTYKA